MPVSAADFDTMFSLPMSGGTALRPGQHSELPVTTGKKVVITDVYIENLGGGPSTLRILEQIMPNSFLVRYIFRTPAHQTTIVNFTTGIRLGEREPIKGSIRIENEISSGGDILPRVNGVLVG